MTMRIEDLATAVQRMASGTNEIEQELNAADAILGDGDTGTMLVRVIKSMAGKDIGSSPSFSDAFARLAQATIAGTGSSLGTLVATALMACARQTKDQEKLQWRQVADLLGASRDAMLGRGGASLGDKTVIDAIDAVANACEGAATREQVAVRAAAAVDQCLDDFRGRVCKIGRARMYEEKSVGVDDPGMLAFAILIRLVTR